MMRSSRPDCASLLAEVLCVCTLLTPATRALGDLWADDIQFASCACDGKVASCGDCGDACCGDAVCCDCDSCGSCMYSCNSCDELTCRLTAMATSMAEQGIVYDVDATQFYQGVTSGGAEQTFAYGGKIDQFLILDSGKLGLWPGTTTAMHVETRFGQDVNFDAVGFAPANVAMLYPKEGEHDTAITGLSFAHFINDELQLTAGKFNALDLFSSLYPQTGRGITGFMNASMVIPISVARVVPLSFMGAGAFKYEGKQIQGGVLVYDTHNCATTSGFDNLGDNGANILGFWRFFTEAGGLPGSHFFGGIWSTGEFVSFDPTGFVIVPDEGIVATPQGGAYTLLYILEQTLWVDRCNKNRNVALLSQWGLADPNTSPIHWSGNVAVHAQGLNGCRPQDSLGIGYFYTGLSNDFRNLLSPVLDLHDVNGVELYYNAAVTDYFRLTTDLQVIDPAVAGNDTAVVFGLRGTIGL